MEETVDVPQEQSQGQAQVGKVVRFEIDQPPARTLGSAGSRRRSSELSTDGSFEALQGLYDPHRPDDDVGAVGADRETGSLPLSAYMNGWANSTNTILGAGTLAVPLSLSNAGLLGYEVLTFIIIGINYVTVSWLVNVAEKLPRGTPRNYEGIARIYLGNVASNVISIVFMLGGTSLNMQYLLLMSKSMGFVFAEFSASSTEEEKKAHTEALEMWTVWLVGLLIALPLSLLRDISKLRFTSTLSIFVVGYVVLFVALYCAGSLVSRGSLGKDVTLFRFDSVIFISLAMTTSNFSCHISAIPIYESFGPRRKPAVMKRIVLASLMTSAVVYQIVGYTSYLYFGELGDGGANIVKHLGLNIVRKDSPVAFFFLALSSVGVAFVLVFSMPITLWSLRSVILSYYLMGRASWARRQGSTEERVQEILNGDPSAPEWTVATTAILTVIMILATTVRSIKIVMSVGGSLGGTFIAMIFPSMFHLAVVKEVKTWSQVLQRHNAPELCMMAGGAVYGLICMTIAVRSAMQGPTPAPTPAPTQNLEDLSSLWLSQLAW